MKNIIFVLFLFCGFVCLTEKSLALSTVYVNNTYTSTSTEGKILSVDVFRTIQEAVDAVDERGTIYISTGLYNESISIKKSLTLIGSRPLNAVGAHPNAPVINGGDAVGTILIDGETEPVTVTIKNLIITRGKYSIAVLHNANVTISQNTITHYQKNGVTFGPIFLPEAGGIQGIISNNVITGLGKTDALAQNGIQISEDNSATISGNIISSNTYTAPGRKWATGILIHQSNGVTISNNNLRANQIGINLIQSNKNTVTGNVITGDDSSKAGIMISNSDINTTNTSTGNTIRRNIVNGGFIGIWSSYSHGNKYMNNIISSATRNGIYLWNSNNNMLTSNTISSIRSSSKEAYGIELDESEGASTSEDTGSRYNTLVDNVVVKSDSGFLLAKNSKKNVFSNNRFNGVVTSPIENPIQKDSLVE